MEYKLSVVRILVILIAVFGVVFPSSSQQIQSYQIFKLENKIGQEEVLPPTASHDSKSVHVSVTAQDRGAKTELQTALSIKDNGIHFTSSGHTSRFKAESIDTLINANAGFPLSESGSIKIRELLLRYWDEKGRPNSIRSALNRSQILVQELNLSDVTLDDLGLRVFRINNGLDEVLWTDSSGNALFLITTDSEGDRRATIADDYLPHYELLNQHSTTLLLRLFKENSEGFAKRHNKIAVLGGTLIDVAHDGELLKNSMVIIVDGIIAYAGAMDRNMIPSDAEIIDATQKYLIPGLWDMHVHLFHPKYLETALLSGVTSVRDMGSEFDLLLQLKSMADDDSTAIPQIYMAGLMDGPASTSIGRFKAGNASEIRTNVQRYHNAGFNQIKVYSNVKKRQFDSIVAEAKRFGMQVVGHLPVGYTVGHFLRNGMKSISHIHYFRNNVRWKTGNFEADNKIMLDQMLDQGVYLDPTLNIYRLTGDPNASSYGRLLKSFVDYGIPVVAGTDNEGTVAEELQSYVAFGVSPLQALKSATIVPAQLMNAKSGTIEQGKDGNMLILDDNPLLNMEALDRIGTVIRGEFVINQGDDNSI